MCICTLGQLHFGNCGDAMVYQPALLQRIGYVLTLFVCCL